jgi:hypothetical protein
VLEAVRTAPPPTEIDAEFISWEGEGLKRHPVVLDVGKWVGQAAESLSLFSELGAPWKIKRETEFE